MNEPKKYSAPELSPHDCIAIPGTQIRVPISSVVEESDTGRWIITTNMGDTIELPHKNSKIWAIKKEDIVA